MSGSIYDDPSTMALLGMAQGFGNAAMPTLRKMPFGAVIGQGAGGFLQGIQAAQQGQLAQQQLQAAKYANQIQGMHVSQMPGMIDRLNATMNGAPQQAPQAQPDLSAQSQAQNTGASNTATPVQQTALAPPDLAPMVNASADKYGIPRPIANALFQQESDFGRTSPNIGQVLPSTAANPGYGMKPMAPATMTDPASNIDFSMQYLAARAKNAGVTNWGDPDQVATALKAYNGGGDPNYVQHVMRYAGGAQAPQGGSTVAMVDDSGQPPQPSQSAQVMVPTPQQRQSMQVVTPNDLARHAVGQLIGMRDFLMTNAMFDTSGGSLKAMAAIQAQLDNIAGPGGIVDPITHNVYSVPGSLANRQAVANAEASGKVGPAIAQAAGVKAAEAPYQAPITYSATGPDGAVHEYTAAPQDFYAATHGGTGSPGAPQQPIGVQGKPVLTPEQTAESTAYGDQSKAIIEAGMKAPVGLQRLDVIDNATQNFRPGTTGQLRLDAGKATADALQSLGITPPSWITSGAAAGETISKEGGYLATELTRSLGSREAMGVFNQVRSIMPNVEMSQGGFQVVTNSLRQGLQRDQDLAQFREQWVASHGGTIAGMQDAFEKANPVEAYASRVVPYPMPKAATSAIPNVIYNTARGPALWDGKNFQALQ